MSWKNDNFGIVFSSKEIKLYGEGHTWAMKLSQLSRQQGIVRIITYSLPDMPYIREQFQRRPYDIFLICHAKFLKRAQEIKSVFPQIALAVSDSVHSKVCLIAPKTIYIGSANFGNSGWHESLIGVRSQQAHDWYVHKAFNPLWEQCHEVT